MNSDFIEAAKDYRYLLDRGYPQRGFLGLVGDRYKLSNRERSILYRGLSSRKQADRRIQKLMLEYDGKSKLYIDGFNVITTVSSYLLGLPVFISMDGFLRDASQRRGRLEDNNRLEEAVRLIAGYLHAAEVASVDIYLDEAGEITGMVKSILLAKIQHLSLNVNISICKNVDKELIAVNDGIVCTSDSEIIDESSGRIFDLACFVLHHHFKPGFIDLRNL